MISIVDDDELVRELTKALVRSLGYAARTFPSVEEFLRSNLDDTSCLILDVKMKGLGGVELQERLIGRVGERRSFSLPLFWMSEFAIRCSKPGRLIF